MKPNEYIARAATARVVYVALYETAISLLPPEGDGDIECYYTVKDMVTLALDPQTVSMVRNELAWLTNWGWIMSPRRSVHFLGRREAGSIFLKADLAARMATGEDHLVSRRILEIETTATPTPDNIQRGTMRRWQGTETVGGGTFDLDS
jgi:hypothetical protein